MTAVLNTAFRLSVFNELTNACLETKNVLKWRKGTFSTSRQISE